MESIRRLFCCAIAAFSISVANATPVTWVDTIDFYPDRYIQPFSSSSYKHDIRDEGDSGLEVALIDATGLLGDRIFFDLSGEEFGGWSLVGYTQLALTGLYNVTVSSLYGDFFLAGSTLTVRGDERSVERSVPEPGALGLLGLALLSLTVASIRKRRAQ